MKQVVIKPHLTEKTMQLTKNDKYTFVVNYLARKEDIKKYVEDMFKVNVLSVRILTNAPERKKNFKSGTYFLKGGIKKAIVTVKEGQKIELFETPEEE